MVAIVVLGVALIDYFYYKKRNSAKPEQLLATEKSIEIQSMQGNETNV